MKPRAATTAAIAVARQRHPGLTLDPKAFDDFLSERKGFLPVHGADLLLVHRCVSGDAQALSLFEGEVLKGMRAVIASVHAAPDFVDDVLQELRLKLLGEGRLAQYAGRGPLLGWLRRAALNTAVTMRQPASRQERLELAPEALTLDPELKFLKAKYRAAFHDAFVAALAALSARERNVLRLNALADASIDELAVMYQVHRATAARWVQHAKQTLFETTQARMVEQLKLDKAELDELFALLRSQLDVSLHRLLRSE